MTSPDSRPINELLVRRVGEEPRRLRLDAATASIGRAPECDIVLLSPFVSRHHASLRLDGAGVSVIDEGGQNGVFVNGQRVQGRRALSKGDQIFIADFELTYWQYDTAVPTLP